MGLYFFEAIVILIAAIVVHSGVVGPTPGGIFLGCLFLVLVSLVSRVLLMPRLDTVLCSYLV